MSRRHRKARCEATGKRRFPTKLDALSGASSLVRKKANLARPYPCPHCGDWHLTSMPLAGGGRRS
jgi:hypothetical protein